MNLLGKKWGSTDQAYKTVITKPATSSTIGSGYRLQDGEGTDLPIYIGLGGYGPHNGTAYSLVTTTATSIRAVEYSDASGRLSPELIAVLATDATNSTTTPSAISSFGFSLEASAIYEFEITLRVRSAATGTGLRTQITGPTSQIDWVAYEFEVGLGTTLASPSINRQTLTALATVSSPATSPAANSDFTIHYRGLLKTTAVTPVGDIGISFHSGVSTSLVTVREGSTIRFRKIQQS